MKSKAKSPEPPSGSVVHHIDYSKLNDNSPSLNWWDNGKPYYQDTEITCKDCSTKFVWTALKQKHWYEELRMEVGKKVIRCPPCGKAAWEKKQHDRELGKQWEGYQEPDPDSTRSMIRAREEKARQQNQH